jgi:UDP-N-acetylmuramoylalanine--D-glutamate ligase
MENLQKYLHKVKTIPYSMKNILPLGAFVQNRELHIKLKEEEITMSIDDFSLKGKHNLYNSAAAALAARAVDVKKENIRESLVSIKALEHRTQFVATIGGIDFINDSKATNVNSTWYALEGMEKPVVLILGGVDKGNDYRILNDLVKEKVHAIVCLGVSNERIHKAFGDIVPEMIDASSAADAVGKSYQLAHKGDVVLLSPACASFDLFKNYEDRGEQFMKAVKNL